MRHVALATLAAAIVSCSSEQPSGPSSISTTNPTQPPPDASTGGTADATAPPPPVVDAAPPPPPPPAAPTFTMVYDTIISQRCTPCHTQPGNIGITQGNLDMTSKAAAFTNLVNKPAAGVSCGGKGTRVVPGQPAQSIMYLKVSLDDPAPCGSKMPLGLPPISRAQDDMIKAWITAGARND